jgi:hypothetical protein
MPDLEILERTELDETIDEDVVHIPCCMWFIRALAGKPFYAYCGVKLSADEHASGEEPSCELCLEVYNQPIPPCPHRTFGDI